MTLKSATGLDTLTNYRGPFRIVLAAFIGVLLSAGIYATGAQSDSQSQDLHEQVEVYLVNVYLTATDSSGEFVPDLSQDDLVVTEDGKTQNIAYFDNLNAEDSSVQVNVVLLVDNSTSMGEKFHGVPKIDIVKNAGHLILNELRTFDLMMIVSYNHRLSAATGPTGDKDKLQQAIAALKPEYRRTALFDGLAFAMDQIKDEWGRKIIVVCSDGQDNASRRQLTDVTESLSRASDYTVLTLGTVYFDPADSGSPRLCAAEELRRGKSNLEALASVTGGYGFFPSKTTELDDALEMLQNLIRNQYSLSYHPTNSARDGSWRKITIACKRKGVKLRYREGYFAHS